MRRDGPMKFEKDFDFESANAQFNKEEIDKEFQSKLKLKGSAKDIVYTVNRCFQDCLFIDRNLVHISVMAPFKS